MAIYRCMWEETTTYAKNVEIDREDYDTIEEFIEALREECYSDSVDYIFPSDGEMEHFYYEEV